MRYDVYLQEVVEFQLLFPVAFKNKWQSSYTASQLFQKQDSKAACSDCILFVFNDWRNSIYDGVDSNGAFLPQITFTRKEEAEPLLASQTVHLEHKSFQILHLKKLLS